MADDYISKPIKPELLATRILIGLKEAGGESTKTSGIWRLIRPSSAVFLVERKQDGCQVDVITCYSGRSRRRLFVSRELIINSASVMSYEWRFPRKLTFLIENPTSSGYVMLP